MLGEYLPLRELQSVLEEGQLNEIAYLVRRIRGDTELDPISDRRFLGRVYDAYFGPDLLRGQRRRLLDFIPEDRLTALAEHLGLSSDGTFKAVADRIAGLPWGPNDATRSFLEFFGYPSDYAPTIESTLAPSEELHPFDDPLTPLFDYQAAVYHRCVATLSPPCARLMVQMPTGSGKTRTAMQIVASFLNSETPRLVLWLAHSEELCEQASRSFVHVWRHLGKHPATVHRWWGETAPSLPVTAPALAIGGFAKLNSFRKKNPTGPSADLVIVDEAHRALAPTYSAVVDWARKPSARIIGLSATPGRSTQESPENQRLARFFNEQIVGIESADRGAIELLQDRGILSRADREVLETECTFHLTRDEWRELDDRLDYPPGFLRRLAEDRERNRLIFERLLSIAEDGARILVFATSVQQSKILCALLVYNNIRAVHIDGNTSTDTRRASIARFRTGDLQVLSNYEVLSTGFDAPGIDVVFIARPTKSLVLYSQMLGRGMRGPAVGGTPYFRLVDVVDNITDYSSDLDDVYDYFAEYWA